MEVGEGKVSVITVSEDARAADGGSRNDSGGVGKSGENLHFINIRFQNRSVNAKNLIM